MTVPASDVRALSVGTAIGPYRITSFIAAGGMGEVYSARDTRLEREVAIKVLPQVYGADPERLRRFEQEARAIGRLNHPNILSVFDMGTHEGLPFIVMELLEGDTLRRQLRDGALPIARTFAIARQVLAGLAAAHDKGIVHRDLKPANVFVTREGHVKILDFGLAKLAHPEWELPGGADDTISMLSTPGAVLGSAAYMSPEQVEGLETDARSDIFAFGSILFELITGQRAFVGETSVDIMAAVLRNEPSRLALANSDAPNGLISIVVRCLEKQPERRFQTARDLAYALDELTSASEISTLSFTARSLRRLRAGAAARPRTSIAAIAVVAAFVSFFALRSPAESSGSTAMTYSLASTTRLTSEGDIDGGQLSPNGVYLAYTVQRNGVWSIRLRHLPSSGDIELFAAEKGKDFSGPTFSPDSNFLYFSYGGDLLRIPLLGGERRVVQRGHSSRITFSPDGRSYVYTTFRFPEMLSAVWVADGDGTRARKLAETSKGHRFNATAWSPDGRSVLSWEWDFPKKRGRLMKIDVASGKQEQFPPCRDLHQVVALGTMTDGSGNIAADAPQWGGQLYFVRPDGQCAALTSDPSQWYTPAGITSDAKQLAARGFQGVFNVWRIPLDGSGAPERITTAINASEGMAGMALLDDGSLVYTHGHFLRADLWLRRPDGTHRAITTSGDNETSPIAVPHSRDIIYAQGRTTEAGRTMNVARVSVDGGTPLMLTNEAEATPIGLSADDRYVLYVSAGKLRRVPLHGGVPEDVFAADVGCNAPRLAPDRHRVACALEGEVVIRDLETRRVLQSVKRSNVSPGEWGNWAADGKSLLLLDGDKPTNIVVLPLDGSPMRPLTRMSSERIFDLITSPDGKFIYCSRGSEATDLFLIKLNPTSKSH